MNVYNFKGKGLPALVIVFCIFLSGLQDMAYGLTLPQQDTIPAQGQKTKQPVYVTTRLVSDKPVIDGKLDDECWKQGNWAGD